MQLNALALVAAFAATLILPAAVAVGDGPPLPPQEVIDVLQTGRSRFCNVCNKHCREPSAKTPNPDGYVMIFPPSYMTEDCPRLCTGILDMALQQDLDSFFSDLKDKHPGHELIAQEKGSVIRSKALIDGWSCSGFETAEQRDPTQRRYRLKRAYGNRRPGSGGEEGDELGGGGMFVRGPLRNTLGLEAPPQSPSLRFDPSSIVQFGKDIMRYIAPSDRIDSEERKPGLGMGPFKFGHGRPMVGVRR